MMSLHWRSAGYLFAQTMLLAHIHEGQNSAPQRRDLLGAGCEKVFEQQISSRKAYGPKLSALWSTYGRTTPRWFGSSTALGACSRS
jgi:hypothetical protein